jgi:hypothetical protein
MFVLNRLPTRQRLITPFSGHLKTFASLIITTTPPNLSIYMHLFSSLPNRHTNTTTALDDTAAKFDKSCRPSVPPGCIFLKEWRKLHTLQLRSRKQHPTSFSTPLEYNDFLVALSPTPSEARPSCEHPRHPKVDLDTFQKHCVVCTYEIYLSFLSLVLKKW